MVIESTTAEVQRRQVQRLLSLVPLNESTRRAVGRGRLSEVDPEARVQEAQYLLPLIMACAEQYSLSRLTELAEAVLPRKTALATSLLDQGLAVAAESSDKTTSCWNDWFGIRLSAFAHWDALRGYREARNTVAHGVHTLTAQQMRNSKAIKSRLRNAGIVVEGRVLVLNDSDVRACGRTVLAFIAWLDDQARTISAAA